MEVAVHTSFSWFNETITDKDGYEDEDEAWDSVCHWILLLLLGYAAFAALRPIKTVSSVISDVNCLQKKWVKLKFVLQLKCTKQIHVDKWICKQRFLRFISFHWALQMIRRQALASRLAAPGQGLRHVRLRPDSGELWISQPQQRHVRAKETAHRRLRDNIPLTTDQSKRAQDWMANEKRNKPMYHLMHFY